MAEVYKAPPSSLPISCNHIFIKAGSDWCLLPWPIAHKHTLGMLLKKSILMSNNLVLSALPFEHPLVPRSSIYHFYPSPNPKQNLLLEFRGWEYFCHNINTLVEVTLRSYVQKKFWIFHLNQWLEFYKLPQYELVLLITLFMNLNPTKPRDIMKISSNPTFSVWSFVFIHAFLSPSCNIQVQLQNLKPKTRMKMTTYITRSISNRLHTSYTILILMSLTKRNIRTYPDAIT